MERMPERTPVFYYFLGLGLRCGLWLYGVSLGDRVELSTPLNSHKRLTEGVALWNLGIDPYSGVVFHETPLLLRLFVFLNSLCKTLDPLYIALDLLTARVLQSLMETLVGDLLMRQERKKVHVEATAMKLSPSYLSKMPKFAVLGYLCNPFIIANCIAKTSTSIFNLVLILFIFSAFRKSRFFSCFFLALSTYLGFYHGMLIVPLIIILSPNGSVWKEAGRVVTLTSFFFCGLLYISYEIMGRSEGFIYSVYGFILNVPELSPNMGLFWYFFTEMFEHFRQFFICTFQLNVFIYLIPLTIRLHGEPYLLVSTLIALISIFKSYPCYGDAGFYMSLFMGMTHLIPFTKQIFYVAVMLLVTSVFGPILYQLWIYNGSANANYFFAINLLFGTAQIFLVTDLLFAHVKRDFYMEHGLTRFAENGEKKPVKLKLRS